MTSASSIRLLSGEWPQLPPQKAPKGFLKTTSKGDWGTAKIYDPDNAPGEVQMPQKPPIERRRLTRQSHVLKSSISEVRSGMDFGGDDTSEIEFWCLPFFQASMYATVIEDVIIELRILVECNCALRVMKTLTDMNLLLALKYGVEQRPKTDELEGINPRKLNCSEYKLVKLESDRNKILGLFLTLYKELSAENCYSTLLDFVGIIEEYEQHKVFIVEDEAKNTLLKKELIKKLRIQANHVKSVTYEADQVLESLKSQIEDAALMTETKGRYVDNWQAARTEQHEVVLQEKESVYTVSTEYFKRRADHESRVHAEVESFTNIIINDNLKAVADWMDKYERDMEKIDLKIQIQKLDWQNMLDKRRFIEKTYKQHAKAIVEWITFKDEREAAQLYSRTMTKCAISVQAWWRGLLVRKQLGPFRQKKGKKGKK